MTTKPEKVKEPSSGEAIASAADHEDLDDEKLTGFTLLPGESILIETFLDRRIILFFLFPTYFNDFFCEATFEKNNFNNINIMKMKKFPSN